MLERLPIVISMIMQYQFLPTPFLWRQERRTNLWPRYDTKTPNVEFPFSRYRLNYQKVDSIMWKYVPLGTITGDQLS